MHIRQSWDSHQSYVRFLCDCGALGVESFFSLAFKDFPRNIFFCISLQVLVTGVEAVEVLHQLLPLKIMACCYDNKNTNTAWPTIPV